MWFNISAPSFEGALGFYLYSKGEFDQMKKRLAVLLSIGMIFSLCACDLIPSTNGGPDGPSTNITPITPVTESPKPELPADTPDITQPEETPEPIPDADYSENALEHVTYEIGSEWFSSWDSGIQKTNIGYEYLMINDDYRELKEFFWDKRISDEETYKESADINEKDWDENFNDNSVTINDVKTLNVTRADSQFFSVTERYYQGYGENASNYYVTVNVDSKTGEPLSIDNFLYLSDDLYDYLAEYFMDNFPSDDMLDDSFEQNRESIKNYLSSEDGDRMIAVFPNGVEIIINEYYLMYGYMGAVNIPIFYDEHPEFFVENCFVEDNDEYIRRLSPDFYWYEDLNGDGQRESTYIYGGMDYDTDFEDYYYTILFATYSGNIAMSDIWSTEEPEIYVAKRGDEFYVLSKTLPLMSHVLTIYRLNTDDFSLEPIKEYSGAVKTIDDFDNIYFDSLQGVFSTFYTDGKYFINDKGEMESYEEFLPITDMSEYSLTTIKEIYGYEVDDQLKVTDKKIDIPVGEGLNFLYSNGVDGVIFGMEDGTKVFLQRDEEMNVCGIPEYEAFEILWYYG